MKILFLGQHDFWAQTPDSRRVRTLASLLGEQGHAITAITAVRKPGIRRFGAVSVKYVPSLNPGNPGGWVHFLFSLWHLWRIKPDVSHIHDWRMAALGWLAALLSPETTFVWTAASIPAKSLRSRLVAWQAKRVFDAISTPSRHLQYRLLTEYKLSSAYIPDGYIKSPLEDVSLAHWGLKKNQYILAIASSRLDTAWVQRAYKRLKTKKKLVILPGDFEDIAESSRSYNSIVRGAAAVIALDLGGNIQALLTAMDAGKAVITANYPLYEEVLGTTGQVVKPRSAPDLAEALANIHIGSNRPKTAPKARIRAQNHFSWPRILEEYRTLYHYPAVRRIPVDSIQSIRPEAAI